MHTKKQWEGLLIKIIVGGDAKNLMLKALKNSKWKQQHKEPRLKLAAHDTKR